MVNCFDKSLKFLRRHGYNVVKHPSADLAPLELVGWASGEPLRLGPLSDLMKDAPAELPPVVRDRPAADIDGRTTSRLPLSVSAEILSAIVKAMGGEAGVTAEYEMADTLEFQYTGVTLDRTIPLRLGDYLAASTPNLSNPVIKEYLFGRGRLYVLLTTAKSKTFGITAYDEHKAALTLQAPKINKAIGGKVKVGYERSNKTRTVFKGDTPLVFGFKCAELALVHDDDRDEMVLTYRHVQAGDVFMLDDASMAPEPFVFTDNGLLERVGEPIEPAAQPPAD